MLLYIVIDSLFQLFDLLVMHNDVLVVDKWREKATCWICILLGARLLQHEFL